METSRSPWKVLRDAHEFALMVWPNLYSSAWSRHDFTLPQLFACLVVREQLGLSYRGAEALLRDTQHWLAMIGMKRAPDHNTLWRAFGVVAETRRVNRMLDLMAEAFARAKLLRTLSAIKPLTIDSTCFEERHRSHHYDRVCRKMKLRDGGKYAQKADPAEVNASRSRKARQMPKLALAVASGCHLILAARASTGAGSDSPDFRPLLYRAWCRANVKDVVADAGFDGEHNHRAARLDMGVRSVIPPKIGRPSAKPPVARFRRIMHQRFARKADRRTYGQRAQSETVNSMVKRNFGDALRSIRPKRREQEMLLRTLTHNVMLYANRKG
jgi:hypothetical protein